MSWLDLQPETLLKDWLRRTNTPMAATLPSGEILWCNGAFEDLLGWTSVELIGKVSWKSLTDDSGELAADIELAAQTVKGDRTDYQFQKSYRTKNAAPKRVVIDVLRYPSAGEFECFLVSIFPVDKGVDFAMGQLTQIRQLIVELMQRQPSGLTVDKVVAFTKEHPVVSSVAGLILGTLLFGERVIEIARLIMRTE